MATQKVEVTSVSGEAIGYSRAVRAGDLISACNFALGHLVGNLPRRLTVLPE